MLRDHISTLPRRCPPALLPWTPDCPWKRTAVSAHLTSLRDPRVYGMRAPPESLSTSGAHVNAGNRTTSRLNLTLTIWSSGSARWKACRIPPIESWILTGPYGIHSGCHSQLHPIPASGFPNCAPVFTPLFTRRTLMRRLPSLSSIGEKPNALCDANNVIPMDTRHLHAMCAREGITHNTGALQKTAEGLPHAAHEC
ncbi:mitochondrial processing peptide beta subunit [Trypanosoma cruzi]|nr:mitochondrial processing peptide beta subunit [Trypanosoma cruzi]